MKKSIIINQKIENFQKKFISVDGDKSLSIRFVLLASLSNGKSIAQNLLKSEDVLSAIRCIKKLGIKIKLNKNKCEVHGMGLDGLSFKKNLTLNAGNSGTTARLICSMLAKSKKLIKITGDKSLMKRDMGRIIKPLKLFGFKFSTKNEKLPIFVRGSQSLKPIKYNENLGSAQCKSAIMIAGLMTDGKTKLRCLPSRNHTELIFKNVLKIPIKIKSKRDYDLIELEGSKQFKSFNYRIPGDISSASFFIVLTLLLKNSSLIIKNVNINNSRIGIIKILNLMGAKIKFINRKIYKGEINADILIKSQNNLKSVNISSKINSSAIDEFLLIFLVASKCKGVSIFHNLSELNKKESKRLDWGIKIIKMMGIKVQKIKNDGVKIWGNPKLELNKSFQVKNYLKDHRIFMTTTIAALALGGKWKIFDPDSFNTSFPSFLRILRKLGAKIL